MDSPFPTMLRLIDDPEAALRAVATWRREQGDLFGAIHFERLAEKIHSEK
jgi:hypothetical protein